MTLVLNGNGWTSSPHATIIIELSNRQSATKIRLKGKSVKENLTMVNNDKPDGTYLLFGCIEPFGTWKERNMSCFEGEVSNVVALIDKVNIYYRHLGLTFPISKAIQQL